MEKIWVITIDEVSDFVNYHNKPRAYKDEDKAQKALDIFKVSIKEDYEEELNDGWEYDEGERFVEVYDPDGYAKDHYAVHLDCVELL